MNFRRSYWSFTVLFVTLAAAAVNAQVKTAAAVDWETFKPENEEFSILMPKDTTSETTKVPYHRFELNLRLYLSTPAPGTVVGVASVSGIKTNTGSEFARFNSYADAFKTFFPPKVRKDGVGKMILQGSKSFHGYTGRIYKLTIGDLTGTVNAYVTQKRFYAIAILTTKKDEALEDKFLASFVIPDKPVEQVATVEQPQDPNANPAANTPQASRGSRRLEVTPGSQANNNSNTAQATPEDDSNEPARNADADSQQANPPEPGQKPKRAPISGGVLNGKAIYLPLPDPQPGQPIGVVLVQVLIDEQGAVIEAKAISGPPALHPAAVNAARLARFMPTLLAGEPVKVTGTLSYNFQRSN